MNIYEVDEDELKEEGRRRR